MAGATNVETEWVYVPDDAVIDEPNRAKATLVWPLYGPMGVSITSSKAAGTRCPGCLSHLRKNRAKSANNPKLN
jgi:hypothetical protein